MNMSITADATKKESGDDGDKPRPNPQPK